jgi:hypothetical protein
LKSRQIRGFGRTNPSVQPSSACTHPDITHPNQVEGGKGQDKLEVEFLPADKAALAQAAYCF